MSLGVFFQLNTFTYSCAETFSLQTTSSPSSGIVERAKKANTRENCHAGKSGNCFKELIFYLLSANFSLSGGDFRVHSRISLARSLFPSHFHEFGRPDKEPMLWQLKKTAVNSQFTQLTELDLCMLLGQRPNSRSLGLAKSVMTIGLSINRQSYSKNLLEQTRFQKFGLRRLQRLNAILAEPPFISSLKKANRGSARRAPIMVDNRIIKTIGKDSLKKKTFFFALF